MTSSSYTRVWNVGVLATTTTTPVSPGRLAGEVCGGGSPVAVSTVLASRMAARTGEVADDLAAGCGPARS